MRGSFGPRFYLIVVATVGCLLVAAVIVIVVLVKPPRRVQAEHPLSRPAGIVTVTAPVGAPTSLITFHDSSTGKVTRAATVPTAGGASRWQFNIDFTMFVWADGGAVHVAKLDRDRYVESAARAPERNVAYGTSWESVVVNPVTGRIWLRETRNAATGGAQSIRVVSIDPDLPGEVPRVERADSGDVPQAFDSTGAPARRQAIPLDVDPKVRVTLVATDVEVLAARVSPRDGVEYECPVPTGPNVLICFTTASTKLAAIFGIPFGSVAELRFDLAAQHVTMRQLVPEMDSPPAGLLVSPDRTQVQVRTGAGWRTGPLPTGGPLRPVNMEGPDGTPIAWIP